MKHFEPMSDKEWNEKFGKHKAGQVKMGRGPIEKSVRRHDKKLGEKKHIMAGKMKEVFKKEREEVEEKNLKKWGSRKAPY